MKRIAVIVAVALLGAAAGTAHADRYWVTTEEPPAPRYTEYRPRTGYVWIEGHWALYDDGWRWIDGHYERDSATRVYVSGSWDYDDGQYRWRDGRWSDRKKAKRYRRDRGRDRDDRWRDRDRDDNRRERRRNRRWRDRD
jgi:hypothetical protein